MYKVDLHFFRLTHIISVVIMIIIYLIFFPFLPLELILVLIVFSGCKISFPNSIQKCVQESFQSFFSAVFVKVSEADDSREGVMQHDHVTGQHVLGAAGQNSLTVVETVAFVT